MMLAVKIVTEWCCSRTLWNHQRFCMIMACLCVQNNAGILVVKVNKVLLVHDIRSGPIFKMISVPRLRYKSRNILCLRLHPVN